MRGGILSIFCGGWAAVALLQVLLVELLQAARQLRVLLVELLQAVRELRVRVRHAVALRRGREGRRAVHGGRLVRGLRRHAREHPPRRARRRRARRARRPAPRPHRRNQPALLPILCTWYTYKILILLILPFLFFFGIFLLRRLGLPITRWAHNQVISLRSVR